MISNKDIRDYLFYLAYKKKVSASTLNGAISALKFYYGAVLHKSFIYSIKRPKKDKTLPSILSTEEIKNLFSAVANLKHKALIMLVYSSGKRR
jgi:site-specific recombinase XerD